MTVEEISSVTAHEIGNNYGACEAKNQYVF